MNEQADRPMEQVRRLRLLHQGIVAAEFSAPEEVVAHLGAMQAQVYDMANWAIGLRMRNSTAALMEQAFQEGRMLRTHLLRPTWHFVTPKDIRWLLRLTAPGVHRKNAMYYRKWELDETVLSACRAILEKSLDQEGPLTRPQLAERFAQSGIEAAGHRLAYIMM